MTKQVQKCTLSLTLMAAMLGLLLGQMLGCQSSNEEVPPVNSTANAEEVEEPITQVATVDTKKSKQETEPEFSVTHSSTLKPVDAVVPNKSSEASAESKANPPPTPNINPSTQTPAVPNTPELLEQVIVLSPSTLNLGEFSTSEKGTGSATLTNTGDEAVTIMSAKASCGCTTSDFKNGTVLQPGESTEFSVTMDGKGRARRLSKTVTFTIAGYPPLRLSVEAITISYVSIDVDSLEINDETGTSTVTLTSVDGQPFSVVSMLPAIAGDLPTKPAATQQLTLDWDAYWDLAQSVKVSIRLDHPLCKEITTNVRMTAEQRMRFNDEVKRRRSGKNLPTKDPTRPMTGDQLGNYIKAGKGQKVLEYIASGLGKYDAVDRSAMSLLSIAAETGDVRTVLGLLELGSKIERVDRVNRTPLMHAARSKNIEVIQILLDVGADIQARDNLGNTPLAWAAGFGTSSGVQLLIDAGADANTVDNVLGYTPLLWASGFGDSTSLPILIEAGADLDVYDIAEGRSPLMHAVRTGKLEGVNVLINAGSKINEVDNGRMTPLHIGAASNNVSIDKIKMLVEAGADLQAKDKKGNTPLDLARGRTDINGPAVVSYLSEQMQSE